MVQQIPRPDHRHPLRRPRPDLPRTTRTRSPSPSAPTACTFAHYWLHNGFLTIDNEKMSKSKGNFFMVRDAAQQFGYETIRMFMLSAHYRTPAQLLGRVARDEQGLPRPPVRGTKQHGVPHQQGGGRRDDRRGSPPRWRRLRPTSRSSSTRWTTDLNTADALVRDLRADARDQCVYGARIRARQRRS